MRTTPYRHTLPGARGAREERSYGYVDAEHRPDPSSGSRRCEPHSSGHGVAVSKSEDPDPSFSGPGNQMVRMRDPEPA